MAALPFQTRPFPKFGKVYTSCKSLHNHTACSEKGAQLPAEQNQLLQEKEHPGQCQARGKTTTADGSGQLRTPKLRVCPQFVALRSPSLLLLTLHQDMGSDSGSVRRENRQRSQLISVVTNSSPPSQSQYSASRPSAQVFLCACHCGGRRRGLPALGFCHH